MDDRHTTLRQRLVAAVLGSSGASDPAIRSAVAARAAALGGRAAATANAVPPPLASYVDKVATRAYTVTDEDVAARAYTVTDEDVAALRQAGYSEDAIFEITISTALGAAVARLERGLAALKGGD